MNRKTILTKNQISFLKLFGKSPLSSSFSLSGGTALAGFYIPYRYSEDLDFFSPEEIRVDEILAFIGSIKKKLGFASFDFNTSFNRNLFFLHFPGEILKLEFTYYPFAEVARGKKVRGFIKSEEDIKNLLI